MQDERKHRKLKVDNSTLLERNRNISYNGILSQAMTRPYWLYERD